MGMLVMVIVMVMVVKNADEYEDDSSLDIDSYDDNLQSEWILVFCLNRTIVAIC